MTCGVRMVGLVLGAFVLGAAGGARGDVRPALVPRFGGTSQVRTPRKLRARDAGPPLECAEP